MSSKFVLTRNGTLLNVDLVKRFFVQELDGIYHVSAHVVDEDEFFLDVDSNDRASAEDYLIELMEHINE